MRRLAILAAVSTLACGTGQPFVSSPGAPAVRADGVDAARASSARVCRIKLREIPDPRGGDDSRVWIYADVGDCGPGAPAWKVSDPGYIEAWHRDKSGRTAWIAGPFGHYTVMAEAGGARATIEVIIASPPESVSSAACLVQVHSIPTPPGGGSGWQWVETATQGEGCGDGPKWSIDPAGNTIYVWNPPTIAHFAGPPGIYRVTARYDGGQGSVDVSIE